MQLFKWTGKKLIFFCTATANWPECLVSDLLIAENDLERVQDVCGLASSWVLFPWMNVCFPATRTLNPGKPFWKSPLWADNGDNAHTSHEKIFLFLQPRIIQPYFPNVMELYGGLVSFFSPSLGRRCYFCYPSERPNKKQNKNQHSSYRFTSGSLKGEGTFAYTGCNFSDRCESGFELCWVTLNGD